MVFRHVHALHVQVLLLVWDDTTNNMPGLGPGVMGTSDEKTNAYFKDTEVCCVLCPRQGGVEDSYLQVCWEEWWLELGWLQGTCRERVIQGSTTCVAGWRVAWY
jgi:hypothetical protein